MSSDSTVVYLPAVKTNITDENGQAMIMATSTDKAGWASIGAFSHMTMTVNLTDSYMVTSTNWGTISGQVSDSTGVGVGNAVVKLWNYNYNAITHAWDLTNMVWSPENPQLTVNRPEVAPLGTYTYYRVPAGHYLVTAEKNGNGFFALVDVVNGSETTNIVIQGPLPNYGQDQGTISGALLDTNGNPLYGVTLSLYDGVTLIDTAVTSDGTNEYESKYVFSNLPKSLNYEIRNGAQVVLYTSVTNGSATADIVNDYHPQATYVTGIVTDKNKNAIAGATVKIFDASYNLLDTITTGDGVTSTRGRYITNRPLDKNLGVPALAIASVVDASANIHEYYANIESAPDGTTTCNIAIPDFVYFPPIQSTISMMFKSVLVPENKKVQVWIARNYNTASTCSVSYTTADGDAYAGVDYYATSGMVTFNSGEVGKVIWVKLIDDSVQDPGEFFFLNLTTTTSAGLGSVRVTRCDIKDNDFLV
jgi:hypothetical protein